MPNKWFNVRNVNEDKKMAELMISGQIGKSLWDDDTVAANEFIATVNALGELDEITIHLNSPGGSVNDGIAIHNYLKRHPATVNIDVLAEASSIASVILQAGDTRSVPKNALIMVHDPMAPLMGMFNSTELRAMAERLDIVRDAILPSYTDRNTAEQSSEEIQALLTAETYMTGEQAVALGFADNLLDELQQVAHSNKEQLTQMFNEMAEISAASLKQNLPTPPETPVNLHEIAINACSEAGFSALAANMVKHCKTPDDIQAKVKQATEIQTIMVSSELTEHVDKVLCHLENPAQMLREVIAVAQAANEEQEFEVQHDNQNGEALSYTNIYATRKNT